MERKLKRYLPFQFANILTNITSIGENDLDKMQYNPSLPFEIRTFD